MLNQGSLPKGSTSTFAHPQSGYTPPPPGPLLRERKGV